MLHYTDRFCLDNIIRESLKQLVLSNSPLGVTTSPTNAHSANHSPSPHHLYVLATRKCMEMLPRVLRIIKRHIAIGDREGSGLFRWDAGIVSDGCFFAGYLAAGGESRDIDGADGFHEMQFKDEGPGMSPEESVEICLRAFSEMRWAFSKGEEREQTIRMVWATKRISATEYRGPLDVEGDITGYPESQGHSSYQEAHPGKTLYDQLRAPIDSGQRSAPGTACGNSTDSSASWPLDTPLGTANSASGSGNDSSTVYSGLSNDSSTVYSASGVQTFAVKEEAGGLFADWNPFNLSAGSGSFSSTGYPSQQFGKDCGQGFYH